MQILLLGAGGREHALAWKLKQSHSIQQLFIAPGNPGTATCGTNVAIAVNDFERIGIFCKKEKINMVLVGPEDPLVNGIWDFFQADEELKKITVIGPSQQGAQLEGSKAFAKEFMLRHQIPTAAYKEFTAENYTQGIAYLQQHHLPIVLKADGLAAGKGVVIAQSHEEALIAFEEMIQQSKFGEAGKKVVVEEFLTGIELSVFVLTDGKNYCLLPEAKDYKRIAAGDKGLNTGGMGAVSPVPFADTAFMQKVEQKVIAPTIAGLQKERIVYRGFLFFGLIKVGNEPYVIEYNCRMGDPETEVVMLRLKNDLMALFTALATEALDTIAIETDSRAAATVMAVSKGYPEAYEKGITIAGLQTVLDNDTVLFHAGTKAIDDKIVTNGGRVLCVSAMESTIPAAVKKAITTLKKIDYSGMYYRSDIGYEFE